MGILACFGSFVVVFSKNNGEAVTAREHVQIHEVLCNISKNNMSQTRKQVLLLYRRILKLSRTWEATNPADTQKERAYIKQEAKRLFKQNKYVTNKEDIKEHLHEGEARVELALHYDIPYPRPINYPQTMLPPTTLKRRMKTQEELLNTSRSIYVKSLYDKKR